MCAILSPESCGAVCPVAAIYCGTSGYACYIKSQEEANEEGMSLLSYNVYPFVFIFYLNPNYSLIYVIIDIIYIQLDEEGESEIEGEDNAEPAGEADEEAEEEEDAVEEEGSGKREDPSFDTIIFPKLRSADQEDIKLETNLNLE